MEQPSFQHSAANVERPDVPIIVPAYEEAESLPELADELRAACEEAGTMMDTSGRSTLAAECWKLGCSTNEYHP